MNLIKRFIRSLHTEDHFIGKFHSKLKFYFNHISQKVQITEKILSNYKSIITISGLVLSLIIVLFGTGILSQISPEKPDLNVKLLFDYDAQRMQITNTGSVPAYNIEIYLESWADEAPASSIFYCKEISSLMPNGEKKIILELNLYNHGGTYQCHKDEGCRSSSSGYIYVMCGNCEKPKQWIFHIPSEEGYINWSGNMLPIIEIEYILDRDFGTEDLSKKYNFEIVESQDYLNAKIRGASGPIYQLC